MRSTLRFGMLLAASSLPVAASSCDDDDHPPFVAPGGPPPPPGVIGGTGGGAGGGGGVETADAGVALACALAPLAILDDPSGADLDFDLAGGLDDFVVAFSENRGGVEDVFSRRVDEAGALGPEERVTDDAARARDPAVVATDSGFLVAFSDDTGLVGDFDVRARAIDEAGVPVGDAILVSSTTLDDLDPALVESGVPGQSILAFNSVDELGFIEPNAAVVDVSDDQVVLAGTEEPVGQAFEFAGPLDLASIGIGPRAVASFLDPSGDLQLLELTDTGTAADVPTGVRSADGFDGTFDLAAGPSGGIFALGLDRGVEGPGIAVRTIDAAGDLGASESPLFTGASVTGRDPAAVALDDGSAVAFRRTTTAGTTIRLAFLDATGAVLSERDVAVAGRASGRLGLARAADGTLLAVFDESSAGAASLRGVRVDCP